MQDKVTYEYAIIRLIPRVEREEFINIGAILFSKRKRFVAMRYQLNRTRIEAFCPDINIELIENYLKAWEQVCKGDPHGGAIGKFDLPDRFRWLTATRSTIIQSSAVHPGLCTDPQATLDDVFERFVL